MIETNNIIESLKWRYATKKFDSNKILSEEQLNSLVDAFNLTATSYGLQPLKLVIIHNKEVQKELRNHSYNQQQVEQASHVLVICVETKIDTAYIKRHFQREMEVRGTDYEVLKSFESFLIDDFGKKTEEEIVTWATKQAYIALGTLLTVCAEKRIDSCPMEGFIPSEYDRILNLNERGLKSVLVLPVGMRADDDMFADFQKVRKETKEIVINV